MATDTRWPLAAHMFTTVPAEGGLFLLVARGSEGFIVGEHLEREALASELARGDLCQEWDHTTGHLDF